MRGLTVHNKGYIEPTLRQLSQLHNFTIESQVQYHAPLAFEPQEVADGFRVDAEDLKVFVNSAEWTLGKIFRILTKKLILTETFSLKLVQ